MILIYTCHIADVLGIKFDIWDVNDLLARISVSSSGRTLGIRRDYRNVNIMFDFILFTVPILYFIYICIYLGTVKT